MGKEKKVAPDTNAALIIIDMQKAIYEPYWSEFGPRNNLEAEASLAQMVQKWRESGRRVIFIRHDSTDLNSAYRAGTDTHAFIENLLPKEEDVIISKNTNSSFIGSSLISKLSENGISQLFFAGVKTNNSVEATVRMSGNLGFQSYLLEDCCFTFAMKDFSGQIWSAEDVHNITLANLNDEYCRIIGSEQVDL